MPKFLGRFSMRGFLAFLGALLPAENGAGATFFFGACSSQHSLSSHDGGWPGLCTIWGYWRQKTVKRGKALVVEGDQSQEKQVTHTNL